jgi:hypothetical protein
LFTESSSVESRQASTRIKSLRRSFHRLSHFALSRAFDAWKYNSHMLGKLEATRTHRKQYIATMVRRWRSRAMLRAWTTWRIRTAGVSQLRHRSQRIALRSIAAVSHRQLFAAWKKWCAFCYDIRVATDGISRGSRLLRRIILRLSSGSVARAFETWRRSSHDATLAGRYAEQFAEAEARHLSALTDLRGQMHQMEAELTEEAQACLNEAEQRYEQDMQRLVEQHRQTVQELRQSAAADTAAALEIARVKFADEMETQLLAIRQESEARRAECVHAFVAGL